MAQFGGDPVNFPEEGNPHANPRRKDPETPLGRKPGDYDPPSTGANSQTEAVRLARRGGSVAPPITEPEEKRDWIPPANPEDAAAFARRSGERDQAGWRAEDDAASSLEIRAAGRAARDEGRPITNCPYGPGTREHYQWTSSWMQPHPTDQEDAS